LAEALDLDYLLAEVVTLPSLPTTVANITRLVNDSNSTLAQVAKAISADPAIALKTLRLVNSAYYGLREQVTSVDHAVVLLGMKVVQNLVLTAAVFDTFSAGDESLLRHSVASAAAMRVLAETGAAKNVSIDDPAEAFTYGLLHDVGKLILQQHLPEQYAAVTAAVARLAQHWKLAPELCDAILGHHRLDQCESESNRALAALLAIADYICYEAGFGASNTVPVRLDDDVWAEAGVSSESLLDVMADFFDALPDIEDLVQLAA
jgi:HD-like signal output (HDOD) protein